MSEPKFHDNPFTPTYVLRDGWPDSGPVERVWVAVVAAPAGGRDAIDVAYAELDGWMDCMEDDGLELIATDRQEWHRESPCLECEGSGADAAWQYRLRYSGRELMVLPSIEGPPLACESCMGTGQQNGDEGYGWQPCGPDDEGAVLFWVLEVVERDRAS